MTDEFVYIYTLEYPLGNIRYVGKSKSPKRRFQRHLNDAKKYTSSHKLAWLHSLITDGKLPFLNIIDKVPESEWQKWERYYILEYKKNGFDLTNGTDRGDGNHNPTIEVRNKISNALRGYFKKNFVWNKGVKGISSGYPKGKNRDIEDAFANSKRKIEFFKNKKPWNYGKSLTEEQKEKNSFSKNRHKFKIKTNFTI